MAKATYRIIETIKHKSGIVGEIKFDPAKNLFFCSNRDAVGERIEGESFPEVKRQVQERMDQLGEFNWVPMIMVEYYPKGELSTNDYQTSASIGIRISRFWASARKNAKPLRCWIWEDQKEYIGFNFETHTKFTEMRPVNREQEAKEFHDWPDKVPFVLPHCFNDEYGRKPTRHFLPYNEDVWVGLNKLVEAIRTAHDKLNALIGSDLLAAQLLTLTSNIALLPAPGDGE